MLAVNCDIDMVLIFTKCSLQPRNEFEKIIKNYIQMNHLYEKKKAQNDLFLTLTHTTHDFSQDKNYSQEKSISNKPRTKIHFVHSAAFT